MQIGARSRNCANVCNRELMDVLQTCPGLLEEVCCKHSSLLVPSLVNATLSSMDAGLMDTELELATLMMTDCNSCISEAFLQRLAAAHDAMLPWSCRTPHMPHPLLLSIDNMMPWCVNLPVVALQADGADGGAIV
jgi:hypothetical protein